MHQITTFITLTLHYLDFDNLSIIKAYI